MPCAAAPARRAAVADAARPSQHRSGRPAACIVLWCSASSGARRAYSARLHMCVRRLRSRPEAASSAKQPPPAGGQRRRPPAATAPSMRQCTASDRAESTPPRVTASSDSTGVARSVSGSRQAAGKQLPAARSAPTAADSEASKAACSPQSSARSAACTCRLNEQLVGRLAAGSSAPLEAAAAAKAAGSVSHWPSRQLSS
mmetsp:Transcript_41548/g.124194  ORF Transcript_41548/g.124194 Transcript_41548/m.124194 type:complete len:200 (-) Transcript_41548:88-687(-)